MGKLIDVDCQKTECFHWKSCCRLPTEAHYVNKVIKMMIVGQGAGWQEEKQRRPWIGKAGQLLRETLKSIFKNGNGPIGIAFANIVRCRPSEPVSNSLFKVKDRPPTIEEVKICLPYLVKDINILKPNIIVLAGANAATSFGIHGSVGSNRGKQRYQQNGTVHMVTYHPAGVLRQPYLGQDMRNDLESAYKFSYIASKT